MAIANNNTKMRETSEEAVLWICKAGEYYLIGYYINVNFTKGTNIGQDIVEEEEQINVSCKETNSEVISCN